MALNTSSSHFFCIHPLLDHQYHGRVLALFFTLHCQRKYRHRRFVIAMFLLFPSTLNNTNTTTVTATFSKVFLYRQQYFYFDEPHGVALDDQFVYWNEYYEEKVFRMNKTAGGNIETVAAGIYSPFGLAVKKGTPTRNSKYKFFE